MRVARVIFRGRTVFRLLIEREAESPTRQAAEAFIHYHIGKTQTKKLNTHGYAGVLHHHNP